MVIFSSFIFCRIVFVAVGKRETAVFHKVYVFMEINHWFLRHLVWNFLQMLLCKSHLLFALIDYGFRLCSYSIQLNFVSHLAVSHIKCIHTYTHRLMILEISGKIGNGLLYQTVNGKPIHNGNYVAELFHQFQTLYANITLHRKTNYYIYAYFLPG